MEKQTVCFTGTCPTMTRDELTQKASSKYDVLSSVTKNLDILVCADPNANSTKLQKAAKNGTKIISYDEFIETLDEETSSEFLTFSDFNFKLVIINELMYEQDLLPKFDVYEFAKNYTQRKIDIDSEGYEPIPEVIEYFKNLQIPSNLADSITELCMDGGDEIHHQIIPFWDGEDEYFDVNQVTKEDLVQFKNLKEATLMIKNFEENKKIFKAQNIKLIDFLNDDFDDDFDDSEENLENEETENDDSNSESDVDIEKQTVCFTGTCPTMTRDELTQKASEKYDVLSSATKNLDILVCAAPNANSTKLQKAAKNGTKIISYDEFIKTLGEEDDDNDDGVANITNEFGTFEFEASDGYENYLENGEDEEDGIVNYSIDNNELDDWDFEYNFNRFCGSVKSGEKEYYVELFTDTAYGTTCEKSIETLKLLQPQLGNLKDILKSAIDFMDIDSIVDTIRENAPEKFSDKFDDDDDDEDEDDDVDYTDTVLDVLLNEVGTTIKCLNGKIIMRFEDSNLVDENCTLTVWYNFIDKFGGSYMHD